MHDLQMPSLNLSTWKSGNAKTKGLPCSLDSAPPHAALRGCPVTKGFHKHPPEQRRVDPGALLTGYFVAPPTTTFNFHFEHRIIHFLAGLLWSSSLWQLKALQTFICTTAQWIPEKLFSLLCSWKHEPSQRHNKLEKFIHARATLSEPQGLERTAQHPTDETLAPWGAWQGCVQSLAWGFSWDTLSILPPLSFGAFWLL